MTPFELVKHAIFRHIGKYSIALFINNPYKTNIL